jgi:uncharacterized membrane protein YgcG
MQVEDQRLPARRQVSRVGLAPAAPVRLAAAVVLASSVLLAMVATLVAAQGVAAAPAGAQSSGVGEAIERADITLDIGAGGTMAVTEVYDYRFPAGEARHGIRRFIPLKARYDDRYDRRFPIDRISTTAEPLPGARGNPSTAGGLQVYDDDNGNRVIHIGDPSSTVSGTWRYTIEYQVRDAVEPVTVDNADFDEVVWNVVGTLWQVPIEQATVHVTAPAAPVTARCFAGGAGSTEPCASSGVQSGVFTATATALSPGQGMTVTVDLPPGTVPGAKIDLVERWSFRRAFEVTPLKAGLAAGLTAIGALGLARLLGRSARDRRLALNAYLPASAEPDTAGLVSFFEKPDGPVRFRPPEGATPGLVGVITDEKADPLDVSATIVDLAVRGYLRIEELPAARGVLAGMAGLLSSSGSGAAKDDFRLRRLRDPDGNLLPYERDLLQRLWGHADDGATIDLSALQRHFAGDLSAVRTGLYEEVMRRKWFIRRPDHVRAFWFVVGALVAGLGLVAAIALAATTHWGLLAIPLLAPGIVVLLAARHMPARTAEGRKVLEEAVGYERFLDVADADQLRYQEEQLQFVAALPYAMVFGLTRKWAEVLDVLQQQGFQAYPSWYVPYDPTAPFRFVWLGAAMSNFSAASSTAMSMPAASTGGGFGGGGGFVGGGGGGGGGGSW